MKKLIGVCLLTLPLAVNAAEIYKWRDSEGNWHFGDTPPEGAEKVELSSPTVYEAPPLTRSSPPRREQSQPPKSVYNAAAIASPGPEATVRNAPGDVSVVVALDPPLQSGHRVRLLLDGTPVGEPVANTDFVLRAVDRGAHKVQAEVVDHRGQTLIRTGEQTFYLHRPSVNQPARGR